MRKLLPFLVVVALSGCTSERDRPAPVIQLAAGEPMLRVNDMPVPAALLNEVARGRGLDLSVPEQRQKAIKELSDYILLAQAARKQNAESLPAFAATVETARLQGVANATYEFYATTHPITDQALKAEYDAQVAKAGSDSYDFGQLLFENEADALKAAEALVGGTPFDAVYAQWQSKAKQARDFADVRLIQLPAPELIEALKALKPGEATRSPVKTQYGWHLLGLKATHPVVAPTFESVSKELRQRMIKRQGDTWMEKLRGEAVILDLKSPAQPTGDAAAPAPGKSG